MPEHAPNAHALNNSALNTPALNNPALVRPYAATDVDDWLRCRLLAFLGTCYYDDVHPQRDTFTLPVVQLVALDDDRVVGLIDVEIDGNAATIDCIAVHPDHQRSGVGDRLLTAALDRLPTTVTTLDAWTREDAQALAWYSGHGFSERYRYLHVYKGGSEPADDFTAPKPLTPPVIAFCHAAIEHEADLRARFARVYVCRQFLREL